MGTSSSSTWLGLELGLGVGLGLGLGLGLGVGLRVVEQHLAGLWLVEALEQADAARLAPWLGLWLGVG